MGSTVASRLLAQLLDMRAIIETLARDPDDAPCPQADAWSPAATAEVAGGGNGAINGGEGSAGLYGTGSAITARGPVFHRVVLAPGGDTVADWRVLAPTDWHFGPRGPVAAGLAAMKEPTPRRVALLVASYDPCAPWALHPMAGN
jgi:hypothetical protein